ncbi:hypothetical protein CEXT_765641 [Caerostris extrusa]|uniref:Uncharacterized protein n=1 Tax=Caerostris extrusa TaxID=172846 RepID=A0AAV4XXK1_CAEEX|nr:hypothetical protein CEXT_765641 [Caerostris extrusa]
MPQRSILKSCVMTSDYVIPCCLTKTTLARSLASEIPPSPRKRVATLNALQATFNCYRKKAGFSFPLGCFFPFFLSPPPHQSTTRDLSKYPIPFLFLFT